MEKSSAPFSSKVNAGQVCSETPIHFLFAPYTGLSLLDKYWSPTSLSIKWEMGCCLPWWLHFKGMALRSLRKAFLNFKRFTSERSIERICSSTLSKVNALRNRKWGWELQSRETFQKFSPTEGTTLEDFFFFLILSCGNSP